MAPSAFSSAARAGVFGFLRDALVSLPVAAAISATVALSSDLVPPSAVGIRSRSSETGRGGCPWRHWTRYAPAANLSMAATRMLACAGVSDRRRAEIANEDRKGEPLWPLGVALQPVIAQPFVRDPAIEEGERVHLQEGADGRAELAQVRTGTKRPPHVSRLGHQEADSLSEVTGRFRGHARDLGHPHDFREGALDAA